jgi:hypothetical protein
VPGRSPWFVRCSSDSVSSFTEGHDVHTPAAAPGGVRGCGVLLRNVPAPSGEERSLVRDAAFAGNVLAHWEKATRGVNQQPRRASSPPQTAGTCHG